MRFSKVATVYANSYFDFALAQGKVDEVTKDVAKILEIVKGSPELERTIKSPIVKPSAKISILIEVLTGRVSSVTERFVNFLGEKNRIDSLIEILHAYSVLKDVKEGVVRSDVKSAAPLSNEQRKEILQRLENKFEKKIILSESIDEDIIGGFVVTVGDTIIDASIKNQLLQVKKKLINSGLSLN